MKNRTLQYFLIALFIIAIATLPLKFKATTETINQTLSLSASIISALSALITLGIAILLFNKYGVESSILDKNINKVIDLLEHLKATRIIFRNDKHYFNISMSDPFKYHKHLESYYNQNIIFRENYIFQFEKIFEISSSISMPPEISLKVDRLQFYTLWYDISDEKINNFLQVSIQGGNSTSQIRYGRFNGSDMTVLEFLNILEDIKIACESWLTNNSRIKIPINP